jgi:hypothetical protein
MKHRAGLSTAHFVDEVAMNANTNIRAGQWPCCLAVLLWVAPAVPTLAQVGNASEEAWEYDYRQWKEDPVRVERYWKTCLSAEDYARAVESTGQTIGAGPLDVGGPWVATGPTGDFAGAPYNGRTSGIAIRDGVSDYRVYVGACAGGLWRASSLDGAGVWTSLGDGLPNPSVRAFAIAPNNAMKIIVGTGDHRRYGGGGMFKTSSEGATWTEVPLFDALGDRVYPECFFRIIYRPGDASTVYAACSEGIFVSSDGGDSWVQMVTGNATDLILHPTDPDTQYACIYWPYQTTGRGVYYTTDAWNTYDMFDDPDLPSGGDFDRASIAICRDFPGHMAVVVENGNFLQGVYRTLNGGADWSDVTSQELIDICGDQVWHAQAITYRPSNPYEIYVGAVDIARTVDGGTHWTKGPDAGIDIGHADITQLYFNERTGDSVMWICNDGGIYRHDLGGATESWNGDAFTGLRTSQIDFMDAQRSFRAIGLQDNGVAYRPQGIPDWSYLRGGDGFGIRITDVLSDEWWFVDGIYGGAPSHRIYRVTGTPPSWEYTTNIHSGHYDLFFDRESAQVFSMGESTLWSTPAFGALQGWSAEPVTIPEYGNGDRNVFGSRIDPETLYVSYWTHGIGDPPALSVCRRLGGVWYMSDVQLSTIRGGVMTVFASTENAAESWAGLVGNAGCPRIVHTTDYWNTWEDLTNELAAVGRVDAIAVTPFNSDQIFVGTDLGVFWSQDGGQSWAPFQTDMPVVRVTTLLYLPRETATGYDKLVAATFGRGMYERPIIGPAIRYVDQGHTDAELGTFEYPYNTLGEGLAATPNGGVLGLRGGANYYPSPPFIIDRPLTINAYDGVAVIH